MRAMELGGSPAGLATDARRDAAVFLSLTREREELEQRLAKAWQYPRDRYRDLLVIAAVIRFQHAQLAGWITLGNPRSPSPIPLRGVDDPGELPEWTRPWGFHAMQVLDAAHNASRKRRYRLERWLPAKARAAAAAEASSHLAALADRVEIRRDLILAPSPSSSGGSSATNAARSPKRVPFSGLVRTTALGATVCVAAGLGVHSFAAPSDTASDSAIQPRPVADAPYRPLPELVQSPRHRRSAGHRDSRHHPSTAPTPAEESGSPPPEPRSGGGSTSEPAPTVAASAPTAAPAAPIAPAPTATTASQPTAAPTPTSGPGPIQAPPAPEPEPAPAPPPTPDPAPSPGTP